MKIKIEGGIYLRTIPERYSADIFFLPGVAVDWSGGKLITAHTIEVDVPDFDHRSVQVEALRAKRKEIHDAFAAAVMEIDQRLNSLLAIENAT